MDGMDNNWNRRCLFCFKSLDTEYLRLEFSESQHVYDSCCQFIGKEELGEQFFKWNNSTHLPICQKCFLCASKLFKMKTKLKTIQAQIDKLVKRFTVEFLREREENSYFKRETASPSSDIDHHDPFVSAQNISLKNIDKATDTEEDTLLYEENQEDQVEEEGVSVKEEVDDDFFGEYSDNDSFHLGDSYDIDPPFVNHKPYLNRRKNTHAIKTKGKKKAEYDEESEALSSSRHILPRRTAALKAAKLFTSLKDEGEKMDAELQSNISEVSDSENELNSERARSAKKRKSSWKSGSNKEICSDVKCKYCKTVFSTETELESHISIHDEERPFACPKCGFRFTTQPFLIRHLKKHFNEKVFKCAHCKNTYKYMHCLKDHVKSQKHHKKSKDECKACEKAIAVGKEMQLARKIDEEYLPLIMSKNISVIKKEKRNSSQAELNVSKMCEEENSESVLKTEFGNVSVHKSKSIGKRKVKKEGEGGKRVKRLYRCLECDKNCYSKRKLLYHQYSHQPAGTEINCEECKEVFTDLITLQNHCSSLHAKTVKPPGECTVVIQCTVCGKIFSSKGNLNKHMYLHSDVKQFPCPVCTKRFSTKSALTAHSVYHKKDRPYLCEECGQGFHTGTKLREHYRVHTGMLLYCEYCPKGFRNSTHLKQHLRVHNKVIQPQSEERNDEDQTRVNVLPFQIELQCFQNDINNQIPDALHIEHGLEF